MPGAYLWAWDATNEKFIKVQADTEGRLVIVSTVESLDDIGDVVITSPAATHFLVWDSVTSKWINRVIADADIPAAIARDSEVATAVSNHAALTATHGVAGTIAGLADITTHAAIKTGVHGVGARYVAETSVEDLDLADHSARHENAGDDEISVAGLSGELADDQPPKAHGADKHTNVTRTLFVPCGQYYTGTPLSSTKYDAVSLDKDTNQLVHFVFRIPSDFVSVTSLKVVWFGDVGGTAGFDWVCDPELRYAAAGEGTATHSESPASPTIDVTAVITLYETDVGFTLASTAIGDYVGVEIERQADAVADTYDKGIVIMGLLFTYTASQ